MQKIIVEQRKKGSSEKILKPSLDRIDKLIEIYKTFDKFYFAAHFAKERIMMLEEEKVEMSVALTREVETLKEENAKLLKSIEWN